MEKRKLSPFSIAVIIWALFVAMVLWYKMSPQQYAWSPGAIEKKDLIRAAVSKSLPTTQNPYYEAIAEIITSEEIELLARLVHEEARGEPVDGQKAVVAVVFNRVMDERFPDTIEEVIYQDNPTQFSPARNLHQVAPTEEQYLVIQMVLSDSNPVLDENVLFFSTRANWRPLYEKIGNHYFCY